MKPDLQKFIFAMFMLSAGVLLCIVKTEYGDQGPWLIYLYYHPSPTADYTRNGIDSNHIQDFSSDQ